MLTPLQILPAAFRDQEAEGSRAVRRPVVIEERRWDADAGNGNVVQLDASEKHFGELISRIRERVELEAQKPASLTPGVFGLCH